MSDFYIIGAGINGLLLARELADSGADVTIIERQYPGSEASWARGGIVSPLYPWRYGPAVTALAGWAQRFYPALAEDIFQESGINPEFSQSGLLMLDAEDESDALAWANKCSQDMQKLSGAELYKQEPDLAEGFVSALKMPKVANVRNPRLCKGLAATLRSNPHVAFIENSEVAEIVIAKGEVNRLVLSGSQSDILVGNSKVIVCAGAWTKPLLQSLGLSTDVTPIKGQMLLYKLPQPPIKFIVLSAGRYLIPRIDGHLLVGSTLENTDFDKTITQDAKNSLRESAHSMLPELSKYEPVAQWAGLRPGSPEGIPVIGAVPGIDKLFVNAGQYRNGLVLAPASARLMADLLLERQPEIDPAPYDPATRITSASC